LLREEERKEDEVTEKETDRKVRMDDSKKEEWETVA